MFENCAMSLTKDVSYCCEKRITQELFGGAKWTDSSDSARRMFAAYRHWVPRFEAAALLEAALPHVREDARSSIVSRINTLTTNDTDNRVYPADARRLRQDTLAMIRAALRVDARSGH